MNKSTPNRQLEIQRQYLTESGIEPDAFDDHRKIWWRNPINHNSLRLTKIGLTFFTKNLKRPTNEVDISSVVNSRILLQLERLFTSPYFVRNKSIIVFSEQDAVMLQLHAGNLAQYLDNMQNFK